MLRKLFTALGAMMLVLLADHATAQTICGDRTELVNRLEKGYAESPRSLGLASNGAIFEEFLSAKGTWSLLVTHPNGQSCLVAAGEAWENLPLPVKGQPV